MSSDVRLNQLLAQLQTEYKEKHPIKTGFMRFWPAKTHADILDEFVKRSTDYLIAKKEIEKAKVEAAQAEQALRERNEECENQSEMAKIVAEEEDKDFTHHPGYIKAKNQASQAALVFHKKQQVLKNYEQIMTRNSPKALLCDMENIFTKTANTTFGKEQSKDQQNRNAVSKLIDTINKEIKKHIFHRGIGLILQEAYRTASHSTHNYNALQNPNNLNGKNSPTSAAFMSRKK